MNLKYYLRGLGIGIVVTAIIMGIAFGGKKQELSNEEIKERARELGMIEESTVLADAADNLQAELQKEQEEQAPTPTNEPAPLATPEAVSTPSAAPSATSEPSATPMPEATEKPSIAPTPEQQQAPTPEATSIPSSAPTPSAPKAPASPTPKPEEADGDVQNTGTVSIQVNSGDGSFTISKKLEDAGLVSSAREFDLYLCENGYDKRLNVGTFEIPANAGNEQIAKILARLE